MPKIIKQLTNRDVMKLAKEAKRGTFAVGGVPGLSLQVQSEHAVSWIMRITINGKRRSIGLGSYPLVTLSTARQLAGELKLRAKVDGYDPVKDRRTRRAETVTAELKAKTFESVAREYIEKKSKEFKTAKQVQKLTTQIENYALPYIGKVPVTDVRISHIVDMLKPIWETKTETANRVRIHVKKIFDRAIALGLMETANPADWNALKEIFPAPSKVSKTTHYSALPVEQMPEFWAKLEREEYMGAKALQFAILTAARSGEIRGAQWSEIDVQGRTWTIPAERMKGGKAHTVPLNDKALALLESMPRECAYVFPSTRGGQLADATISKAPKRIGYDVTAHGFRSTFKDWARKYTGYADEVTELALAHVNNDSTRAAYARDSLIDKRRNLMQDWAQFIECGHVESDNKVVSFGGEL